MSVGRIELVNGVKKNIRYATYGGGEDIVQVPPGIPLGNVENLKLGEDYGKLLLVWADPSDVVYNGESIVEWSGTKVVRKEGSYPVHPDDGELIIDSKARDRYKSTPLEDTGLQHDKEYYYALFPYSKKGVITLSDVNRVTGRLLDYYLIGEAKYSLSQYEWDVLLLYYRNPENLVVDGVIRSSWAKTVIVFNTDHYPVDEDDGVVVVERQGNQSSSSEVYIGRKLPYSNVNFFMYDLVDGQMYYFIAFVHTTDGKVRRCELGKTFIDAKVNLQWSVTKVGSYGFAQSVFYPNSSPISFNCNTSEMSINRVFESNFTVNSPGGEGFVMDVRIGTYLCSFILSITINGEKVIEDLSIGSGSSNNDLGVQYLHRFVYERGTVEGMNTINVKCKVVTWSSTSSTSNARGPSIMFCRRVGEMSPKHFGS